MWTLCIQGVIRPRTTALASRLTSAHVRYVPPGQAEGGSQRKHTCTGLCTLASMRTCKHALATTAHVPSASIPPVLSPAT